MQLFLHKSWFSFVSFCIQVSPLGHAAILAAIKRCTPRLVIFLTFVVKFVTSSVLFLFLYKYFGIRFHLRILLRGLMLWNNWRELRRWKFIRWATLKILHPLLPCNWPYGLIFLSNNFSSNYAQLHWWYPELGLYLESVKSK